MPVLQKMSSELDHAREMAERIARRVSGDTGSTESRAQPVTGVGAELAAVRAGLNELQRKISQLERVVSSESRYEGSTPYLVNDLSNRDRPPYSQAQPGTGPSTHSPWLAGINASYSHPSQEQFGVEEATVTELVDFFEKEKLCSVEPGEKPCDHCAMCSSRGF